jgi:hypothetical protein
MAPTPNTSLPVTPVGPQCVPPALHGAAVQQHCPLPPGQPEVTHTQGAGHTSKTLKAPAALSLASSSPDRNGGTAARAVTGYIDTTPCMPPCSYCQAHVCVTAETAVDQVISLLAATHRMAAQDFINDLQGGGRTPCGAGQHIIGEPFGGAVWQACHL